jgi:hypothetical protein
VARVPVLKKTKYFDGSRAIPGGGLANGGDAGLHMRGCCQSASMDAIDMERLAGGRCAANGPH